jgi:hypothetical protein
VGSVLDFLMRMDKRTVGVDHSILLKKREMFKFDIILAYLWIVGNRCKNQLEKKYIS